jgi:hypothetical protein
MAECRAMTCSRLGPDVTPSDGPTKAEIMSPVIAVMSAVEIEPTVAPPTSCVRAPSGRRGRR